MEISLEYAAKLIGLLSTSYGDKLSCQKNVKMSALIDEEAYNRVLDNMVASGYSNIQAAAELSRDMYEKLKVSYLYPEIKLALIDGKPEAFCAGTKTWVLNNLGYEVYSTARGHSNLYLSAISKYLNKVLSLTPSDNFLLKLADSGMRFHEFEDILKDWDKLGEEKNSKDFRELCRKVDSLKR